MEFWFVVALVAATAVLWFSLRQIERQAASFRDELLRLRQETQSALGVQIGHLVQSFNQQLADVRATLQKGLSDSGQLASQSQQAVSERLGEAARLLRDVGQQLGGLQEAGRELRATARTLESVLSAAPTRGSLGEVALERLLADALPQEFYELQYRFDSGAAVDAVVKLGEKLLPVDSKFPLDAYRRLTEAGEPTAEEQARREFARAVRKHADDIAAKYILPSENTLEVALMFVASESVCSEVLITEDSKGNLADYCRSQRVVPVSPNSLYAYLAVILMGLRGMQVEENARRLLGHLSGLQLDLESFAEVYDKLGTHLKNAGQSYTEASTRLEKVERGLTALSQGQLPESAEARPIEHK